MKIDKNSVVSLAYTLKDGDGQLLDEADATDPLYYLHGHENLLPEFEARLNGQEMGFKVAFSLSPEEGYGTYDEEAVFTVERAAFPEGATLEEGAVFLLTDEEERNHQAVIVAIDGDDVTVDLNHPLAGETLHFDVEVLGVRVAQPEEITHGHVHGPGGHHHH